LQKKKKKNGLQNREHEFSKSMKRNRRKRGRRKRRCIFLL
jgi:hypothetical protein